MRRPWIQRQPEETPEPLATAPTGRLFKALRARVDGLNRSAAEAAKGVEADYAVHGIALGEEYADGARDLVSALNDRMSKIAGECEQVSSLLERYTELMMPDAGSGQVDDGVVAVPSQPAPEEPSAAAPVAEDASAAIGRTAGAVASESISEGIRLLVTQMSMAGAERGEIERRLREDFGVADASGVVADIFAR